MLIGLEPQRFAEMVLAELRGWFDEDGGCPFWDHVASKFFRLEFDEADMMSASTDGQFILDLAPRHPIYAELLPKEARDVLGRVHREGEAARAMLETEGFRYQGLIDIFDAGPTVAARRDDIKTVRDARRLRLRLGEDAFGEEALVSTGEIGSFRAVRAPVLIDGETAIVGRDAAQALRLSEGDMVRVKA
jgi:arginine N-succinyltransferase